MQSEESHVVCKSPLVSQDSGEWNCYSQGVTNGCDCSSVVI